jgi:MtrB/PioB family decaheme-associated outer membrane protein
MNIRAKLLLTCVTGALVIGAGPMMPSALAEPATNTTPAASVWTNGAPALDAWWFHGELETGGRVFLNNPQKDGMASQGGKSLSKYYEYKAEKPGPFLNGHLSTGTNDGLYQFDLWAKNVGYDDQRFNLNASKAGQHYFNVEWDQTPHNYGSGQTIYNGVGTNALTLPAGLAAKLFGDCGACAGSLTPAQAAAVQKDINSNLHQTNIGIRRDTASMDYRWTPMDAWDVRVNYARTHRWGTQVNGIVLAPTPEGPVSQVPKPVNDTTQNFGVNGEYAGTSFLDKRFTFKLGYSGSIYQDGSASYTVDDPFCPAGAVGPVCAQGGAPSALVSQAPNNQANGFNATLGADLPLKSRYAGTVSYIMMRQNQAFLPFTNDAATGVVINGQPASSLAALPALSLNGAINTFLTNNVLTTQITPELKSKLSYRQYDYQNNSPELFFKDWILTDAASANAVNPAYAPVHSLAISYTKQNAGADLNWAPTREWNVGAAYGYERYDWTRADVNVTNENSGKVYVDWKPAVWITARASWLNAERRYDNYDYRAFIGNFQWINPPDTRQSSAMRQFYLSNRDRNKGQFSVAVDVIRGLTITPTFAYQDDAYRIGPMEVGLTRNQSRKAGVELAYAVNPGTTLLLSYMNELSRQNLRSTEAVDMDPLTAANTYNANVKDTVNSFMGAVHYAAIPNKLDLSLSYTVALSNEGQPLVFDDGRTPSSGQYPDVKNTWQRLEATAKYMFDKETVQQLGWKGDVTATLRYAWERNNVDNWQNDMMKTYMYTAAPPGNTFGYMNWLAYNNPNYDVQLITAALSWKW